MKLDGTVSIFQEGLGSWPVRGEFLSERLVAVSAVFVVLSTECVWSED